MSVTERSTQRWGDLVQSKDHYPISWTQIDQFESEDLISNAVVFPQAVPYDVEKINKIVKLKLDAGRSRNTISKELFIRPRRLVFMSDIQKAKQVSIPIDKCDSIDW